MTAYSVDLDELARVVAELEGFQKSLRDKLDRLDQLVAELHLTWTGQAATAQAAAHQRWQAGAAEMHQGVLTMHEGATIAEDNYHSAGQTNLEMFRETR